MHNEVPCRLNYKLKIINTIEILVEVCGESFNSLCLFVADPNVTCGLRFNMQVGELEKSGPVIVILTRTCCVGNKV